MPESLKTIFKRVLNGFLAIVLAEGKSAYKYLGIITV